MKHLLVLLNILIGLGVASLLMAPTRGLAQDAGAVKSNADQAEPSANEEPPPGGCMPIGVTASGEIVFPFLCKGFIERHKAGEQPRAPAEQAQKGAVATEERGPGADAERKTSNQGGAPAEESQKSSGAGGEGPSPDAERKASDQAPAATHDSGEKPSTAEGERPASEAITGSTDEKSEVRQPESTPPEIGRPMLRHVEAAPPPKPQRDKPRESRLRREERVGPPGCTHFRSYDRDSGTYTDYSGRRRVCGS